MRRAGARGSRFILAPRRPLPQSVVRLVRGDGLGQKTAPAHRTNDSILGSGGRRKKHKKTRPRERKQTPAGGWEGAGATEGAGRRWLAPHSGPRVVGFLVVVVGDLASQGGRFGPQISGSVGWVGGGQGAWGCFKAIEVGEGGASFDPPPLFCPGEIGGEGWASEALRHEEGDQREGGLVPWSPVWLVLEPASVHLSIPTSSVHSGRSMREGRGRGGG